MMLWAGKTGCTHIITLNSQRHRGQILIHYWRCSKIGQNPRSKELQAATAFRHLGKGNSILADFIDNAIILCGQCNYPEDAWEQLLWDAAIIGLLSRETYLKCIKKGSILTLNYAIEIVQKEEATSSQVNYSWPKIGSNTSQAAVNKLHRKGGGAKPKHKPQWGYQKGRTTNQLQGQPKKKPFYCCGAEPSHPRSECSAEKVTCYSCGNEEHYSNACRSKEKNFEVHVVKEQPAATVGQ